MYQNSHFPKSPLSATEKADRSVSFGSEQAVLPHSVPREVGDLREDIEHAIARIESRSSIPEIHRGAAEISATDNAIADDATLSGINFLAGRAQATATIGGVKFSSVQPGKAKNDTYAVKVVLGAGADADLAAAYNAGVLTVTLGTDGGGAADAAKNTNVLIVNAVNGLKNGHVQAELSGVNAAVGVTAETALTGGTGAGISVHAYDAAGTATSLLGGLIFLNDTTLKLEDDTVVGAVANGDVIAVVFTSHTARSNVFTITAGA